MTMLKLAAGVTAALFFTQPNPLLAQSGPVSIPDGLPRWLPYNCAEGVWLSVALNGTDAFVNFRSQSFHLEQIEAASGTRYSDGQFTWHSKGDEGFLTGGKESQMLARDCKLARF